MLDRFLDNLADSPAVPVGFIIFTVYLAAMYFLNKERSEVKRMRGSSRFQPNWGSSRAERSRRRSRRRKEGFKPRWNQREGEPEPGAKPEETESAGGEDPRSPTTG